jgi:hypothetical protein
MVKHHKTKTRKVKKQCPSPIGLRQCHPRVGENNQANGCFPEEVLKKVSVESRGPLEGGSQETLLHAIAKHLGVDPKNQRSLLAKLPVSEEEKAELAKKWLRPEQPSTWKSDPDMWLDSNNIRDVMKQYEEANPKFKFLGPYPIDFAARADSSATSKGNSNECLIDEMCNLDLDGDELAGKEHIGIIYNLDPHYKNGSHWVANYINIPKKTCYYFDSYGMKPPRQVYKFMQWLSLQEPDIQLGWNGRRFQKLNSECGMYSMYFIDRMIAGEPFLKFCRRAPPDQSMLGLRSWMFST